MAYVVARRDGRFEIRESVQTTKGPRARTLANFVVLTDDVLLRAAGRATRPFDAEVVRTRAARRVTGLSGTEPQPGTVPTARSGADFVASSRRFARSIAVLPEHQRVESGTALIDLLGFAEEVTRRQPRREAASLQYPPLARLVARRRAP